MSFHSSILEEKIKELKELYEMYLRIENVVEDFLKILTSISSGFERLLNLAEELKKYKLIDSKGISNIRTVLKLLDESMDLIFNNLKKYYTEKEGIRMELHKLQLVKMYHEYLDQLREE